MWVWLLSVIFFGLGLLGGFFLGRSQNPSVQHQRQLESELDNVRKELNQYQDRVTEHFKTTAELVNQMTESYRAVYEHLSAGAQHLGGDETPTLAAVSREQLPTGRATTGTVAGAGAVTAAGSAAAGTESETPKESSVTGTEPSSEGQPRQGAAQQGDGEHQSARGASRAPDEGQEQRWGQQEQRLGEQEQPRRPDGEDKSATASDERDERSTAGSGAPLGETAPRDTTRTAAGEDQDKKSQHASLH